MTANEGEWLAERFEGHRAHLRAVAYRMLGERSDAEDAVQEAWLRLSRTGAGGIDNLGGWLTTVVARVCLDMLRSRKSRREEPLDAPASAPIVSREDGLDPEQELVMAESVGLALLVVLDTLDPAERVAFVLHDMFAVPFDEIAPIVGRSPATARQLASRARRRVQGADRGSRASLAREREVVDRFLAALRGGDIEALVAVLDPAFVIRVDAAAAPPGAPREVRGARNWAKQAIGFARSLRFAQPALVDGAVGVVVAPRGRLFRVLRFTIQDDKVVRIDVVADPGSLSRIDLAVLDDRVARGTDTD